jgi:staphylococcal nuclease domain-containing protein 1
VDYGNRETVPTTCLAILPSAFSSDRPFANEYVLAFTVLPPDDEDKLEARKAFDEDVLNKNLLLNVEYRSTLPHATLSDPATSPATDLGKRLVSEGFLLVEKRRERKLANIVSAIDSSVE